MAGAGESHVLAIEKLTGMSDYNSWAYANTILIFFLPVLIGKLVQLAYFCTILSRAG
jgi:hypothetical protein